MRRFLLISFLFCALNGHTQIELSYDKLPDGVILYAENTFAGPVTIWMDFTLTNLEPSEELKGYFVVPGNSRVRLVRFTIRQPGYRWVTWNVLGQCIGDFENAYHDPEAVYRLPFEPGVQRLLSQGINGCISHQGKTALDFPMDEKSVVLATRDGTVIAVKEDSRTGCNSPSCMSFANYVSVLHDDGSIGTYMHLYKRGVLVSPGEHVRAGEVIAQSGNTGWSSGPHLHFEVTLPSPEGGKGVGNLNFFTSGGIVSTLSEGQWYSAP